MKILLANNTTIPVHAYGGTERVIWWLGKALVQMGHEVVYLVKKGSTCPFAEVLVLDDKKPLAQQIPDSVDVAHFHFETSEPIDRPLLFTVHGNSNAAKTFHPNTVWVSRNHAYRHGGSAFVHNGIDPDDYGTPMLDNRRQYFHFLANAAWRVKNVRGAIDLATQAGERLHVIGGSRVNFRMGLRITISPNVRFHGMLGGDGKNAIVQASKGLIFPVLWHEPFGLAIVESLFFGCPVFGTPYGALPELLGSNAGSANRQWSGWVEAVHAEFGFLSNKKAEIAEAIREVDQYDRRRCHEYAMANFSAQRMAQSYLHYYEKVANGETLHPAPIVFEPEINQPKFLPLS